MFDIKKYRPLYFDLYEGNPDKYSPENQVHQGIGDSSNSENVYPCVVYLKENKHIDYLELKNGNQQIFYINEPYFILGFIYNGLYYQNTYMSPLEVFFSNSQNTRYEFIQRKHFRNANSGFEFFPSQLIPLFYTP